MSQSAEEIARRISQIPSSAVSAEAAAKAFAHVKPAKERIDKEFFVIAEALHNTGIFSRDGALERIRKTNNMKMKMDRALNATGDKDGMLEKVITLAALIDAWSDPRKAYSWAVDPAHGLTFYGSYVSSQVTVNKFPVPLDAQGMYHVAREWLKSEEADKIRNNNQTGYMGGDGSYSDGWAVSTQADVPDQYSQVLTVMPHTIYYGK